MVRIERYGPLFHQHASVEAIDCAIKDATAARNRIDRQISKLKELRERRFQEIESGEWPPNSNREGDSR